MFRTLPPSQAHQSDLHFLENATQASAGSRHALCSVTCEAMAAMAAIAPKLWLPSRVSPLRSGFEFQCSSDSSAWKFRRPRDLFWSALCLGLSSRARTSRTRARALGSIEQFKVFGPPEDPFIIETDKVLGVGGQGTVYVCHRSSTPNIKHAVKTIPIWRLLMDPSCDEKIASIRKETEVLQKIQGHPNICECLGCFDAFRPGTSQAQYIMIVMEVIDGGELASFVGGLSEEVVKSVMRQTVSGLKFIHDKDVVHRDLKVENILVCGSEITARSQVKVIDFGVAKSLTGTIARSCVGTTEIMAPELVSAKLMLAPKGASMKKHGPYKFKAPQAGGEVVSHVKE